MMPPARAKPSGRMDSPGIAHGTVPGLRASASKKDDG